jgi:hypothetical protein
MTITLVLIMALSVANLFLYHYKKRQGTHKEWRYKLVYSAITIPLLGFVIFMNLNQMDDSHLEPFGNVKLDSKEQVQVFNDFYNIYTHGISAMLVQQESFGTKLSIKVLNESLDGKWVFKGKGTKEQPALTITNGPFHKPYSIYWDKTAYDDMIFVIQTKGDNTLEYRHLVTAAGDGKSCTLGFTPNYLNLSRNSEHYDGLCGKPLESYNTFSFPGVLIEEYVEKVQWTKRFASFVRANVHVGTTVQDLNLMLGFPSSKFGQVDKDGNEIGTMDLSYFLLFDPEHHRVNPLDIEGLNRREVGAQLIVKTDSKTSEVVDFTLSYLDNKSDQIVQEDIHGNKTFYKELTTQ